MVLTVFVCSLCGCDGGSSSSKGGSATAPTVTSVTPATVLAGAADTTITVGGSGFTSITAVSLNNVTEATTYVSASQVTAVVPAAQLATAASLSLSATNGVAASTSITFAVNNPAPVVSALSVTGLTVASAPAAITVTGTGFVSSSTVQVNGSARTTTFVSATQLSFSPTVADLAQPGTLAVTVSNAAPGGGTSAAVNIAVIAGSPTITSVSPNSILTGSADTTVTVTGSNFLSTSVAMIGPTALATTYVSSTQIKAVVPEASLTSLGWLALTVQTPTAGSASSILAIQVVKTVSIAANHIVYDPYTRMLWATIGATTGTPTSNSLVSIDPATGAIGTTVALSDTPYALALSDAGDTLYALSATAVFRYDITTNTVTSAVAPSSLITSQGFSIAPGTENELLLGASSTGTTTIQVYDYNTSTNTVTARAGSTSMSYHYGYCPVFLNSGYLINPYNSISDVNLYPVSSTGLGSVSATYTSSVSGEESGCMKTSGTLGYSTTGNIYAFTPTSITKAATLNLGQNSVQALTGTPIALDFSLHQAFFGTVVNGGGPESLTSADTNTNQVVSLTLPLASVAPDSNLYYSDDLYRWGQDGLALLLRDDLGTATPMLVLMRGPFVVPGELSSNTAASLTSASLTTVAVGSFNTVLTLTGSNFVPGVAVTWNGSYRTTTLVNSTQLLVNIPASDFAAAGVGTLVATNPGAPASSSLTVTVQ